MFWYELCLRDSVSHENEETIRFMPSLDFIEKKRDNYRCVAYLFSYIRLCKLYAKI